MSTTSDFYTNKRRTADDLLRAYPSGFCLVMSASPGTHSAVEVTVDNAARLIVESSHRLATVTECEAFHAAQALARSQSVPVDGLQAARALHAAIVAGKERK
jgi:hypothetical protein